MDVLRQLAQQAPEQILEQGSELPEGLECVDQNVLLDLRRGEIDKLPESALECLSSDVRDRIPDELIEFASANPYIALGVIAVAVLATGLCLYKLLKRALLAALALGVVAAIAWWWGLVGAS
ncbi:MAG: hypothetical protein F4138_01425 [Acidimicrobiia bacterium]|nr:hypothetical protein [Acidimicrobiia bacterium]